MKNNCYELIFFIQSKFISFGILLQMLWNFCGMLCVVLICSGKYFMIFEVMQHWYEIYVGVNALIFV